MFTEPIDENGVQYRFQCGLCSYRTNNRGHFREHQVIHTGERQFICPVCEKGFTTKNFTTATFTNGSYNDSRTLLLANKRKDGTFFCEYCDYQTRVSTHLYDHVRTHTGERPYSCPTCHQSFSVKSSMLRHLNNHFFSGHNVYKCKVCLIPFKSKHALSSHCKFHHK